MSFWGRCVHMLVLWGLVGLVSTCLPSAPPPPVSPGGIQKQALREAFDTTYSPTLYLTTRFLYTGTNPVQTGMDSALIKPERISVAHGVVKDSSGQPLPGVQVIVRGHPEFGRTRTNSQGKYYLVLNNIGVITLEFTKEGRIPAQRTLELQQIDYVLAQELWMSTPDPAIQVDFGVSALQVIRGRKVSDARGERRPTLLLPPGTVAKRVSGGVEHVLPSVLDLRLTELSVGNNDPRRLHHSNVPDRTPIYALAASVDQASALGSREVRFSKPLVLYLENILGYPVGYKPKRHSYNDAAAKWLLDGAGLIVKVVRIEGGIADLDTNGDGLAETDATLTALGISTEERSKIAGIYSVGQVLSRSVVTHFSFWVYDETFGACCVCCVQRSCTFVPHTSAWGGSDPPCLGCEAGSVIEGQTQFVGESFPIAGSPFSLTVQSNRTRGQTSIYARDIILTGPTPPPELAEVQLTISVAGQLHQFSYPPTPNQETTFVWDGKDTFGQEFHDRTNIQTTITYVFNEQHGGVYFPITRIGKIGLAKRALGRGLGGLQVDVHHSYDPQSRKLYKGDGGRVTVPGHQIQTVAGGGTETGSGTIPALSAQLIDPRSIDAHLYWGGIYIADRGLHQVRALMGNELLLVAGTGVAGYSGDGGPAEQAQLNQPSGVAVWPEENVVFIADTANHRIRKVWYGTIETYVGTGVAGFSGDGGPASQAQLNAPESVSVLRGVLYIADTGNHRIRRVEQDGTISTVAGTGEAGFSGDGGAATAAKLNGPVAVNFPFFDSRIYIADTGNHRVRMVDTQGNISTVAGTGVAGFSGDGGASISAQLASPSGVFYRFQDSNLYIADLGNSRVRRVNQAGIIGTFAGVGTSGFSGDLGLARHAQIHTPRAIAQHPSGTFLLADAGNVRIRALDPATPQFTWDTGYQIPSEDGSEIYRFDYLGYHHATLDAHTGAIKYLFKYVPWNTQGELILSKIVDRDCDVESCTELLRVERDAEQYPTALVAAHGQQTTLTLNTAKYISQIQNPAGETYSLTWTNDRLVSWTDPRGSIHGFFYDSKGRLIRDEGPTGFSKDLVRTELSNGSDVAITTALGRTRTYKYRDLSGGERWEVLGYDGLSQITQSQADGTESLSLANGTVEITQRKADPQYGTWGSYESQTTLTMPSGLSQVRTQTESVVPTGWPGNIPVASRTSTVSINGRTYTNHWTGPTKTETLTSPVGRTRTATLNDRGLPQTVTVPAITPVTYTYDSEDRLTQLSQGPRSYSLSYNSSGHLASLADSLSRTVSFSYNTAGRLTQQTLPDGRVIQFAYDAAGNLTSLTPPGRPQHSFGYTGADQLQSYTPPALGGGNVATQYTYNAERKLTQIARPDGTNLTYSYDSAGRLANLAIPGGQLSYSYDATKGQLIGITAPDGGTLQYAWDGSLQTDVAWTGAVAGSLHRTYDANHKLTSESVNGGNTVSFSYDNDGLLTTAGALSLSYSSQNGLPSGTTLGTVSESFSYNGHGEVMTYEATASGQSKLQVQYTRDNGGRITHKAETLLGESHTYEYIYDSAGRLTQVKLDGVVRSTYTYDSNSNRLTHTTATSTNSGTYDNQDRLTQYGNASFSYNANGELTQKTAGTDTTTYGYDVLGNLKTVTLPDGTAISYVMDGKNRRIGKKVNGSLQQGFLYQDQLRIAAELDGTGAIVSRFVYGNKTNVPEYLIKAGSTYRIVTDHLGSPRLVINTSTNAIAQRIDYDEFGNILTDTAPGFQPFGFAGGLYDQHTKLVRFGARDYAADLGRWTAKDPIRFAGGDPNLYGYVLGDPIDFIDSSGRIPWLLLGGAAMILINGYLFNKAADVVSADAIDASEKSGLRGRTDGPQDAIRHCVAACMFSGIYNESIANFAGDAHEAATSIAGEQNPFSEKMDKHNNACGAKLGKKGKPDDCLPDCMNLFNSGMLINR